MAGRQNQGRLLQESSKGAERRRRTPRARLEDARIPSAQRPKFPALEMAKNVDDLRRAAAHADRARQKDKAGSFLWSCSSDLWTYSANRVPRDRRLHRRNRSRHADWASTGNWARSSCGTRPAWRQTVEAHEERRQAGRGQRREAARLRARRPGTPTIPKLPAAASISTSHSATTSRKKFPPASGRSPSPRNPTAWSRKIPAPRWSISATASAASSSTPR